MTDPKVPVNPSGSVKGDTCPRCDGRGRMPGLSKPSAQSPFVEFGMTKICGKCKGAGVIEKPVN
jgi:DnaJ-class molecular chaperone